MRKPDRYQARGLPRVNQPPEPLPPSPLAFLIDRGWRYSDRLLAMQIEARGLTALGIGLALAGAQAAIELGAGPIGERAWIVVIERYERNSSSHCRH